MLAGMSPYDNIDLLKVVMCESMMEGNQLYDLHGVMGYLSMDEVVDNISELNVCVAGETFIRPCPLSTVAELLQQSASTAPRRVAGGVIVVHPFSFSLLSNGVHVVLFDGHGHGGVGALLARVPVDDGVLNLRYFFRKHCSVLEFCEGS